MKKNKMMRIASFLLIAVLLTTSVISGTFAKYVTSDRAEDSARVAIFGVQVKASGTLFSETYLDVEDGNVPGESAWMTVESSNEDKLVAPGTTNADPDSNEGFTFSITGKPEVAVKVELFGDDLMSDIFIAKGLYPNMTQGDVFEEDVEEVSLNNVADYYPIQWTLTRSSDGTGDMADWEVVAGLENVSLHELLEGMHTYFDNDFIAPNTDLSEVYGYFNLTWKWAFDGEQTLAGDLFYDYEVDTLDTLLGDLAAQDVDSNMVNYQIVEEAYAARTAAGEELTDLNRLQGELVATADGDYSIDVDINLTISVTQVD